MLFLLSAFQERQSYLCLFQQFRGVHTPRQILLDVDSQEAKISRPLHTVWMYSGKMSDFLLLRPRMTLLGLLKSRLFSPFPYFRLLSVGCLISLWDEPQPLWCCQQISLWCCCSVWRCSCGCTGGSRGISTQPWGEPVLRLRDMDVGGPSFTLWLRIDRKLKSMAFWPLWYLSSGWPGHRCREPCPRHEGGVPRLQKPLELPAHLGLLVGVDLGVFDHGDSVHAVLNITVNSLSS